MVARRTLAMAVALVVGAGGVGVVTACGDDGPAASTPTSAGSPASQLLEFRADRVGGGTVDGGDYRGRPVAFWFWAPD